jgi:hypothetical protein
MIRFIFRWIGVLMASSTVLLIGNDIVTGLWAFLYFTVGGILMFLFRNKNKKSIWE